MKTPTLVHFPFIASVLLGGLLLPSTSVAQEVALPVTAFTSPVESDWTAVYYSRSPLLLGNDGATSTGGFHTWSLTSTTTPLREVSARFTGRTKLVTTVYDVGKTDLIITIAQTDSLFRVFDAKTQEVIRGVEKEAIGDWSALCPWRSPKSGNQYFYLFGKKQARQYLVREKKQRGFEIVEVHTFNLPVEASSCAVSTAENVVYFSTDDGDTIYAIDAAESTTAPTVRDAGTASDDVTGLAIYTGTSSDYILVALSDVVEVYSTSFELLGSMILDEALDAELQGLALYQGKTELCPAGCLTYAIESEEGVAFGISSIEDAFDELDLDLNTKYDPRSKRHQSKETICRRCSYSGFCQNDKSPCDCFDGFTGKSCKEVTCTDNCSGHGKCVGPNTCRCDPGWGGLQCSFLVVQPKVETDANGVDGDDPAIWISPSSLDRSRVLTTTKSEEGAGLAVFDLDGNLQQVLSAGEPNNVDVIYGFTIGNRSVDLAYAACRADNTLCLFEISPTGTLSEIAGGSQPVIDDYDVYGSCVYKSPQTETQYLFVNNQEGLVLQYSLTTTPNATLSTTLVRTFTAGSGGQVEGCVVDDDTGYLFIGEEAEGLWRYPAEPTASSPEGVKVASVAAYPDHQPGDLYADVEGVTLVYGKTSSDGFILVSCQGVSAYNIYERAPPHDFVETFTIARSKDGAIDAVSNTDGIAAVGTGLNARFASGLVVVHDDANELPQGGASAEASFKLVSLADVLRNGDLLSQVDAKWDPRD